MKKIYADYAATTPVDKRILRKAIPYFSKIFGNPSSSHNFGFESKKAINEARDKVASFFNCDPKEIIFTSGGTESENLAIKGVAFSSKKKGRHVIISAVEHSSVDSSAHFLERQGFEVTKIGVDKNCFVNISELESAIREDTILISIMYVNNEIGTIQPIKKISSVIKRINKDRSSKGLYPIHFHVDGEAGSIYLDYDVNELGVDSISINGSKIYSLKGASALYVRGGSGVATQISGGGQEFMMRGGTENVPAVVALAEALSISKKERSKNIDNVLKIKNYFIERLKKEIPSIRINTPMESIPSMLHITVLQAKVTDLVKELNDLGIAVSRGAACSSNKNYVSQVLGAMNFSSLETQRSLRFSFGKFNKKSDIAIIIKALKKVTA